MKLLYCPHCQEIRSLSQVPKQCGCKMSGGMYLDSVRVEVWGDAIPLGIANASFLDALQHRPKNGLGKEFIAFVIPKECSTVRETK